MLSWPSTLPQDIFTDQGPTYTPQSNVIRTSMTTGPAKMRRRFTAVPSDVTVSLELDEAEIAILEDFVVNQLSEVEQFTWKKFHTGEPANYRFPNGWSSVKLQWFAGDLWTVTLALELMP